MRGERPIGVVLQREAGVEDPAPLDLHRVGTTANVLRYVTAPDGNHHLICQGQQRFRILEFVGGQPFLAARFELVDEPEGRGTEIEARFMLLRERALEAVELLPQAPRELADTIRADRARPGSSPTWSPAPWTSARPRSRRCWRPSTSPGGSTGCWSS